MFRTAPRYRAPGVLAALALAVIVGAAGAVVGHGLNEEAAAGVPQARYLDEVPHAPAYAFDVLAAGYHVCGRLDRGETPDDIVADSIVYGIGGDLFTADGVRAVVAAAQRHLCAS